MNYDKVSQKKFAPVTATYQKRDTILYALGIGAGQADPGDPQDLALTYEAGLQAVPSMAVILCPPEDGFWIADPQYDIKWQMVLHGEQKLTLYKPVPAKGTIIGQDKIEAIHDKGEGKGAVMRISRTLKDAASGDVIGVSEASAFLRGDGGFGGSADGAPKPHPVPERAPDLSVELPTRTEQALIYRLSGDYNPLHIDPKVAKSAGFDKPILHGLCSYGIACRALVRSVCEGQPARLHRFDVRFSSPVYPGETIVTDIWKEGEGKAAFRCRVKERDLVVINNGYAEFCA